MAPSFLSFKELRRRSRASFRTDRSTENTDTSSNDDNQNTENTTPTTGSITPPSITPPSIAALSDPAHSFQTKDPSQLSLPLVPPRPPLQTTTNTNRFSVSGMTGLGSPTVVGRTKSLPVSQYAPRISNIVENSWVWFITPCFQSTGVGWRCSGHWRSGNLGQTMSTNAR
ncbi:uncharacterized protein BCR38DRAFT_48864 [Pseudomassariella vexata]|uniref:Uncharacterized protein n=1 Tax=Pseudomassariella vexata TaxID=1141098 RepID=A0A1Y2DNS6_9PEZI|nr:uncharacterized protein BCR38DRAFT_48864 [Pseudomassariella vexata]ORY60900.1 hypothetical protein BCR38DRAFT_48864 [Pseudomassariella vexata]